MTKTYLKCVCVLFLSAICGCGLDSVKYTVAGIEGGGYVLDIEYKKRHLKPITAEGMFPLETGNFIITFSGKGENLSYAGRNGFYYPPEKVTSDKTAWDYCYAWVDKEREFLYLNAYWLIPPDKMVSSSVSGIYALKGVGIGK